MRHLERITEMTRYTVDVLDVRKRVAAALARKRESDNPSRARGERSVPPLPSLPREVHKPGRYLIHENG